VGRLGLGRWSGYVRWLLGLSGLVVGLVREHGSPLERGGDGDEDGVVARDKVSNELRWMPFAVVDVANGES
jgi:hypothetical protein